MNDELQRLVAHPRYRSHPRMLVGPDGLPDLTDDATVGILLGMATAFRSLKTNSHGRSNVIFRAGDRVHSTPRYDTKGEAIVSALLRQWGAE